MTRSFFLAGLAAAVVLTSVHFAGRSRAASLRGQVAGRCASQRRRLRWSGYTAADFA
jgi:hypothetical protein